MNVPLLIVRFKDCFVLINLPKCCTHRFTVEVTTAALKLMSPKSCFHHPLALVPRFPLKERFRHFTLRPPTKAVAAFASLRLSKGFHLQVHVQMKNLVVAKGVLTPRAPQTKIASKPATQARVHLNRRRRSIRRRGD